MGSAGEACVPITRSMIGGTKSALRRGNDGRERERMQKRWRRSVEMRGLGRGINVWRAIKRAGGRGEEGGKQC